MNTISFEPIQIWPEPTQPQTLFPINKKDPDLKKETDESRQKKWDFWLNFSFLNSKILRKIYRLIAIFLITGTIVLNGYFIFTKLPIRNSPVKNSQVTFSNDLFKPIINSNILSPLPVRLKIPKINLDASIQQVGQTPDGAMEVPSNTTDVGWYKFGPIPGQKGSAVIDAHFDGPDGLPAVFSQLHTLKVGDSIVVENDKNISTYFIVKKIDNYPVNGYASDVFDIDDGVHLNLITCNGSWDTINKTYTERLIVFADAVLN